jgi:hypothetical protein
MRTLQKKMERSASCHKRTFKRPIARVGPIRPALGSNALGAAVSWFPSWRSWRRQLEPERKRAIELNSEIKLDSPIKSECRAALLFATGSREHLQELQEIAKANGLQLTDTACCGVNVSSRPRPRSTSTWH